MKLFAGIIIAIVFCTQFGCDKGLTPPPANSISSISGRVIFSGVFPECDTITTLAVVTTQIPPPLASDSIAYYYIEKQIFANTLSSCPIRDTTFTMVLAPGTYTYLGVIAHHGSLDSLTTNWEIIGFLHNAQDSALPVVLAPGKSDT